jgi:hypothetical protein
MRAGGVRAEGDFDRPARHLEKTILEEVIELHPERLTIEEIVGRIAVDPEAFEEVDAIRRGVRDLRRSGLLRYGTEEVVEPTHAAMAAHELFTGS